MRSATRLPPARRSSRSPAISTRWRRRRSARCRAWRRRSAGPRGGSRCRDRACSVRSVQLQVAVELPLRYLLVGGLGLALLYLDEVVDVVAVAGPAKAGSQSIVARQFARGVEQVRREQLDPLRLALGGAQRVQVGGVGLAGLESPADSVKAGAQHR